jgi:FkbM family methyltransferase
MGLGHRSKRNMLLAPFRRGHYRAAVNMVRLYPRFRENLWRFLTARGAYPYDCQVRTPTGLLTIPVPTSHDLLTVNEVFCRQDYRAGPDLGVAVDVGSNIGVSALYFLTRNTTSRCHLFEPDPRNVRRLRENLRPYEDRYTLQECAVGPMEGTVEFGLEPIGRYGAIGRASEEQIEVRCRHVNSILEEIVGAEGHIDVLKVDIEGLEIPTVEAIRPDLLEAIDVIYFEENGPAPLHQDRFDHAYDCQTNRLTRRRAAPASA